MEGNLHRLVYISSAIPDLKHSQIQNLVDTSCHNNDKFQITGLLLFVEGNFMQVLEGSREHVLQLYENIKIDSRHTNLITMLSETITERMFPDWSLAFRTLEPSELESRCNHHSLLDLTTLHEQDASNKVYILIKSFLTYNYIR